MSSEKVTHASVCLDNAVEAAEHGDEIEVLFWVKKAMASLDAVLWELET